ncbi:hypothetical protein SERLA73DRAFT_69865 [Serpula lacrymans var. lacrymans S7.3]|uniref:Uncharacterized protein n=2 Tax=Serpula lacrymans var. lacrymans TaxID=341189 RepID=F8PIY0_SERL3|nr:uncharacterized protein SERLADRAFT_433934 [Serpula lacrymans var. lacrymans S7.9]EGO04080.1 hypothetical protein SERLA73DRAFT_69865 [Serpula lacrymans var. lacrymans S7.3]EGO30000.1 hypothetical protein SERLADRAFT_433934 [Serpula lacrymans var. lacrymans S7.9]
MPQNLWILEDVWDAWMQDVTRQFKLRRAIRAGEWVIFQKYSVFPPLPLPLLPRLKSLVWKDNLEETRPLIRFLLGPSLTSVYLNMAPRPVLERVTFIHALTCIAMDVSTDQIPLSCGNRLAHQGYGDGFSFGA